MRYLKRLAYIPQGIGEGIVAFINKHARDIENRKRFSQCIIDKGSSFSLNTTINTGSHILGNVIINNCEIGKYSYINRHSMIQNAIIGNFCSISHDVNIGLGKHPLHLPSLSPIFYRTENTFGIKIIEADVNFEEYEKINIGHDVWIGARALVMDGVTIGTGAVVAAGSVVTKNVSPYAIVGGVPAKILKYRFEPAKIDQLLNSEWWTLSPSEAYQRMKNL